jgi:hypothetical protein
MDKFGQDVTAIITAIIGVAIVAVVLSNGANTVNVLWSFFQGMVGLLSVAISPITGQSVASGGTLTAGWQNTGVNGFTVSGGVGTNGAINSITGSVNSASALISAGTNGIMNGAAAANALSGLFGGSSGLSSLFGGSSGLSNTTGIMSGASDAAGTAVTGIVNNGMLAGI